MTYAFARETYDQVIDEIKPLLVEHWRELALYQEDIPLDPDYEIYRAMDHKGALAIYTIRYGAERRLVGYAIYFLRNHHHYRGAKWATSDIVLVAQSHRNLGAGNGLFDYVEQDLRNQNVNVIHTMTKLEHPELAFLLESRGHQKVEVNYSKRL
jgi:GNAT superfamily N-acetyltransferase